MFRFLAISLFHKLEMGCNKQSRLSILLSEVRLKDSIPSGLAIDLVLAVSLAGALGQVALGPLAETGCYLRYGFSWVIT